MEIYRKLDRLILKLTISKFLNTMTKIYNGDGTINERKMNDFGLGWKNCKLEKLNNILPLHDNSQLRGNNNLYYYETFKDLVPHRKVSNLMSHGMTVDSLHHGTIGNPSRHGMNDGRLHYKVAYGYLCYEMSRDFSNPDFGQNNFYSGKPCYHGMNGDSLCHEENIGFIHHEENGSRLCQGMDVDISLYGKVSALLYYKINLDFSHHGMAIYLTDCGYLRNHFWKILEVKYRMNILFNVLFYRQFSTEWTEEEARKRMDRYRMLPVEKEHTFLIPPTDNWSWGKNLSYNKESLVKIVAGRVVPRKDTWNMDNFLKHSSLSKVQLPENSKDRSKFNPIDVPLLDLLSVDMDRADSWTLPSRDCVSSMQANRGLSLEMVKLVEVKEIIVGVTPRRS